MKPRPVFIAAATADYTAARSVLQFLTERGRPCFFCDEALLRAGEAGYLSQVDAALEEAGALVVAAGNRERADAEWVRFAWRQFSEAPGRNIVTMLCHGMAAQDLPKTLRRGICLPFPEKLESLERALFPSPGESLPEEQARHAEAAPGRRSSRLVGAMTACNLLILGAIVWLFIRNGGRLFPPREEVVDNPAPFAATTGRSADKQGGPRRPSGPSVDPSVDPAESPAAALLENLGMVRRPHSPRRRLAFRRGAVQVGQT